MILSISTVSYFAMASDLGFTVTPTEFSHHTPAGTLRQIWWVRYVDWILSGPLLLLTLLLITGKNLSDICTTLFMFDVLWLGLLVGGLVRSTYKWGFYVFGVAGLIYTWVALLGPSRASAARIGTDYGRVFLGSSLYLSILFLLYPIAWGCADGGNVISVTSEFIWYGILDVLAKPFFLLYHMFALRTLDMTRLHFQTGKYTDYSNTYPHPNPDTAEKAPRSSDVNSANRRSLKPKFFPRMGRHDVVAEPAATHAAPQPAATTATGHDHAAATTGDTHAEAGRLSGGTFVDEGRLA